VEARPAQVDEGKNPSAVLGRRGGEHLGKQRFGDLRSE